MNEEHELHRGLSARQIRMIALGGTIGVGLFMGATSTIKWTGPSVIFAYLIAGIFLFLVEQWEKWFIYIQLLVLLQTLRVITYIRSQVI